MAGDYPDKPSRQIAYDADGTVVVGGIQVTGTMLEPTAANITELNDEDNVDIAAFSVGIPNQEGANNTSQWYLSFIWPELREIDGCFVATNGRDSTKADFFEESGDSTNGISGTFNVVSATDMDFDNVYPDPHRDNIRSFAESNVRVWRIGMQMDTDAGGGSKMKAVHIYGEISPGETPDRLLYIDEITGLEFSLPIDYGNVPRGSARDRELRLKNNSGSLTANTLQITAEALYLNSGSWYTFDVAGGGFVSTNSDITSLGSGASSGLITIRQIVPDSELVGPHTARAFVNVASWS